MGDKTFHELLEEEQEEAEAAIAAELKRRHEARIPHSELSKPKDVQRTKVMGEEDFYKNLTEKAGKPLPHSELNPDAGVTGKGMFKTDKEKIEQFKQRYKQLDECTNTACSKGNYDVNEYMRGMANGLILARAIMNGEEPEYIPAPDTQDTAASQKKKRATQDWLDGLSIMQQSVLLSAIRGMDGMRKFHEAKHVIRFYRRCVLVSAFDGRPLLNPYEGGGGSFTGPWPLDITEQSAADAFMNSRDEMPLHYYGHFMHGAQIIGYKHPDKFAREFFYGLYHRMVHALHLWPESEHDMDKRLSDDPAGWEAREDPSACCSD